MSTLLPIAQYIWAKIREVKTWLLIALVALVAATAALNPSAARADASAGAHAAQTTPRISIHRVHRRTVRTAKRKCFSEQQYVENGTLAIACIDYGTDPCSRDFQFPASIAHCNGHYTLSSVFFNLIKQCDAMMTYILRTNGSTHRYRYHWSCTRWQKVRA